MKTKNLISAFIILFAFASTSFAGENKEENAANASAKISGKVIDQRTGESLAGVMIKIEEMNMISYTDLDGNFEFNNLTPGKYKITGSLISYEKKGLEVEANSKPSNLKFTLNNVSGKK